MEEFLLNSINVSVESLVHLLQKDSDSSRPKLHVYLERAYLSKIIFKRSM